jgi:hypothetical protein
MDEAERCTEVGFIENGRLLAKASPRALKDSFRAHLLEIDVEPLMPALVRLRDMPEVLGVSLRSGSLRLYAPEAEQLIASGAKTGRFRYSIVRRALGTTRYGRCFHRVLARLRRRSEAIRFMRWLSFEATASVAYKEFLHIYRDRRVLLLVLLLPPLFTTALRSCL